MRDTFLVKTVGYLVSSVSVILLGIVAGQGMSERPVLMACLLMGIATSLIGMFLRWWSYRCEKAHQREREALGKGSAQ